MNLIVNDDIIFDIIANKEKELRDFGFGINIIRKNILSSAHFILTAYLHIIEKDIENSNRTLFEENLKKRIYFILNNEY